MTEFLKLKTVEEAWQVFRGSFAPAIRLETSRVADAQGRTLAQAAMAPHDLPTFVRSTVDGYAVRAADTFGASPGMPAYLDVVGESPMGTRPESHVELGQAMLIHTGGMVPPGADAVIMLEYTSKASDRTLLAASQAQPGFEAFSLEAQRPVAVGENCIQVGEDVRAGEVILPAGHTLRSQDLGARTRNGHRRGAGRGRPLRGALESGRRARAARARPGTRPGARTSIVTPWLASCVRRAACL